MTFQENFQKVNEELEQYFLDRKISDNKFLELKRSIREAFHTKNQNTLSQIKKYLSNLEVNKARSHS